ncbi:MAG: glycosyltransferase 87 family protein [Candidatus Solibacter sp.]
MNDLNIFQAPSAHVPTPLASKFVRRCCALYLCALIGFWTLAVGESYARVHRRHATFSFKSLFFRDTDDRFHDFTNFDPDTGHFSIPGVAPGTPYLPAAEGVYLIFARILGLRLPSYLLFIVASATASAVLLIRALSRDRENGRLLRAVVAASLVLSYPMLFLLERANLEGFIWAFWGLGLAAFVARKHKTAAVLFALIAAMKIYPGVMLLLLLSRKLYKEIVLAGVAFVGFTLLGLQLLGPTLPAAIADVKQSSSRVAGAHLHYSYDSIRYEHSLFSVIKQAAFFYYGPVHDAGLDGTIQAAAKPYVLVALCVLPVLYWFRIRKLPLLNQATALILVAVTFPHLSIEYTLIHLYFPWALFLLYLSRDVGTGRASLSWPVARGIMLGFAFVFAMGPFGLIAGQLKMFVLMAMLAVSMIVPMRSSLLDGDTSPS